MSAINFQKLRSDEKVTDSFDVLMVNEYGNSKVLSQGLSEGQADRLISSLEHVRICCANKAFASIDSHVVHYIREDGTDEIFGPFQDEKAADDFCDYTHATPDQLLPGKLRMIPISIPNFAQCESN